MEVGATIDSPETAYQPDLLQAFASTEVTLFGLTDTFENLAALCPVDLNDPRITVEATNEFVVKAANEAGLEIDAKYESVFSQVTEKLGLETMFKVAPVDKAHKAEVKIIPEHKATENKLMSEEVIRAPTSLKHQSDMQSVPTNTAEIIWKQRRETDSIALMTLAQERLGSEKILESEIAKAPPTPTMVENVVVQIQIRRHNTINTPTLVKPRKGSARPNPTKNKPALPNMQKPVVLRVKQLPKIQTLPTNHETIKPPTFMPYSTLAEKHDNVAVSTIDESTENLNTAEQESLNTAWETELYKAPLDLYDDFAESLFLFMDNTELLSQDKLSEAYPLIAKTAAERLTEIDGSEKEQVALILQAIAGTVHGIHVLEAKGCDLEIRKMTEKQLGLLCVSLFDALGIEYDEDSLHQFIMVMLSPGFSPALSLNKDGADINIEGLGTHETNHFTRLLNDGLHQTSKRLEQTLGTFALLYARPLGNDLAA